MSRVLLRIPANAHNDLRSHLLTSDSESEQAGFIFARRAPVGEDEVFDFLEWFPVPPDGFLVQSDLHFELTDLTRAGVIKRAHDLEASIVEFHTHSGPWPAQFSPSDLLGLGEFVPHVWWRLKGRPYLAVVMTETDYDGLAWIKDAKIAQRIDGIDVDGSILESTRLSSLGYKPYGD